MLARVKPVIALVAMVLTVHAGGQAAILAPTEILAEQHFKGMEKQLETISQTLDRPINIRLLTGSTLPTHVRNYWSSWRLRTD
jgi:ATP-dependent DNA helicase RecG